MAMEGGYGYASVVCVLVGLVMMVLALHRRRLRQKRAHIRSNIRQLALLRSLIAGLQRHRGLSNGVLCGDAGLSDELAATRRSLEEQMRIAATFIGGHADGWSGLIDHWSRLQEGRSTDAANNLAQHHLIIRNSIFLMEDVASEIDLSEGRSDFAYLPCIWREVVQAAEWAGQARALGTGIAAAGKSSAEQRIRLRFLYQKIEQLAGDAFATLQAERDLFQLARRQQAIEAFLLCIEQELLGREQPSIAAKRYFQHATLAIEELLGLVDTALLQLQPQPVKGG